MEISDIDLTHVKAFAERVISLSEYRSSLHEYLRTKMHSCAPNLANLIGEQVCYMVDLSSFIIHTRVALIDSLQLSTFSTIEFRSVLALVTIANLDVLKKIF